MLFVAFIEILSLAKYKGNYFTLLFNANSFVTVTLVSAA